MVNLRSRGRMTTYKTGEIVTSFTLKLGRITETVDESGQYAEYHSIDPSKKLFLLDVRE